VYALHSRMSELDYAIEPEVECSNNDPNDVVEEYVACKMYPLALGFGFESMPLGTTPVSKVETPLSLFAVGTIAVGHTDRVLVEIEIEAGRVLGSFGPREYDAFRIVNILNGDRLNRVLEQVWVPYAPRPLPGSEASQLANKKQKAEVSKKLGAKRAKAGPGRAPPSKMALPPPKIAATSSSISCTIAE
jgi:hypothetical protein